MKSQEELQDAADRAFELLEQKSPHQLAVELAHLQRKHAIAVAAVNRIGVQRDRAERALNEAGFTYTEGAQEWTPPIGPSASPLLDRIDLLAGLILELREGAEIHLHNCTVCKNEEGIANWTSKLERIDAALDGELPGHVEKQSAMMHPVNDLTADETLFLAWACAHPGSKNEDIAWGNEKDGVTEPLWKKLESLGLIECVGSYKWTGTGRGRAALTLAAILATGPKPEEGAQ